MPKQVAELKPPPFRTEDFTVSSSIRKRTETYTLIECRTFVWAEQDYGWDFDLDTVVDVAITRAGTIVTVQFKTDEERNRLKEMLG